MRILSIVAASIYSMGKGTERAYQASYDNGKTYRVVERGACIRAERLEAGQWVLVPEPAMSNTEFITMVKKYLNN